MTWTARKPRPPADPTASELSGRLAQIRHQWPNSDGSVALVADLETGETVRGTVESHGELAVGSDYKFLGQWREHEKHGWQFSFDAALLDCPDDPDGLVAYLSRHAERVGAVTAARLVAAYGPDAARVLIEDHAHVAGDGLMSETDAALAAESLRRTYVDPAEREAHQQLYQLLRGHGFWGKCVKACMRLWGASAPAQVRRDPFLLLTRGLPGCGFVRVDRLYLALGRPARRLKRQALAAWHALASLDGDTWADAGVALAAVRAAIGGAGPRHQRATALLCRAGLAECVTDERGRVWIAERHKAVAERRVAQAIRTLSKASPRWGFPLIGTDLRPGEGLNPETDDHQIEQITRALGSPLSLLTGSPGTGKTHCAALVIRETMKMVGRDKVAVVAPTGKAAVRITEKMAEAGLSIKATTIHSCLKVGVSAGGDGWSFAHGPHNPLPYSHVFLDETSMVDTSLAASFLSALTAGANLMLIGDDAQLPPVGHGAFLRDVIAAHAACGVGRGHLSQIRRNSGRIVTACHEIKDGKTPRLTDDLSAWTRDEKDNAVMLPWPKDGKDKGRALRERLDGLYDWLGQLPQVRDWHWSLIDDVQVIVAKNTTRQALNRHLQHRLNAAGAKAPHGDWRQGDKVICLKNGFVIDATDRNHQPVYVCNGDVGRVRGFRGKHAVVELASPRRVVLVPLTRKAEEEQAAAAGQEDAKGVGGNWDLAYAVTCWKYQGSEVRVAVCLLEPGRLGSRELVYTMISRARDLCVLLGDRGELGRMVRNVTLPDRKTFLQPLLTGEMTC